MNSNRLSRLMKMSWAIQKTKNSTRSRALLAAWAIFSNEEVTVFYLTQKLNHHKPVKDMGRNQLGLFTR